MAYDYISRGKAKENGYTNTRVFKMFGVSSTGYYNYVSRREDRDGKQAAREMDESYVKQCFKQINHNTWIRSWKANIPSTYVQKVQL